MSYTKVSFLFPFFVAFHFPTDVTCFSHGKNSWTRALIGRVPNLVKVLCSSFLGRWLDYGYRRGAESLGGKKEGCTMCGQREWEMHWWGKEEERSNIEGHRKGKSDWELTALTFPPSSSSSSSFCPFSTAGKWIATTQVRRKWRTIEKVKACKQNLVAVENARHFVVEPKRIWWDEHLNVWNSPVKYIIFVTTFRVLISKPHNAYL